MGRGLLGGNIIMSRRKAHACKVQYKEVFHVEGPMKRLRERGTISISFNNDDCEGDQYPHDNPLVVPLLVSKYTTRWVLVDNESLVDILFWNTFTKIIIDHKNLRPFLRPLKGFSRDDAILVVGNITLPGTIGKAPFTSNTMQTSCQGTIDLQHHLRAFDSK